VLETGVNSEGGALVGQITLWASLEWVKRGSERLGSMTTENPQEGWGRNCLHGL